MLKELLKSRMLMGYMIGSLLSFGVFNYIENRVHALPYNIVVSSEILDEDAMSASHISLCSSPALGTSLAIYVVNTLGEYNGRFYTENSAIVLSAEHVITLDTIAHEVSHYVDYVIMKKGIRDGETRAYLQGYFTQCVYDALDSEWWKQVKEGIELDAEFGIKI